MENDIKITRQIDMLFIYTLQTSVYKY